MKTSRSRLTTAIIGASLVFFLAIPDAAQSNEEFYKGKSITYNLATTPGGSWDIYLRVLTKHFADHIPGRPTFIMQYMPGGGGIKALNYLYKVAPKDGTYIATPLPTSLLFAQLNADTVAARPTRMNWIGSMAPTQDVISLWHTVPAKSLDDARNVQLSMGATGTASNTFFDLMLANKFLGTKFKPVLGYQGTSEIDLAMQRGEIQGRAVPWDGWVSGKPDWLRDKKINTILQIGLRKSPEIGNVPLLGDLIDNAEDKTIANLVAAYYTMGRTIYTPPDVPADRVAVLRKAFTETMTDPAYIAEAKAHRLGTGEAISGAELQELVDKTFSASSAVVAKAKAAISP